MPTLSIHPTPNPNSLKFTTEGRSFTQKGMLAFGSADEAKGHDLGSALFRLEGVVNVFALPEFLTVTKSPEADWDNLINDIRQVVSEYLAGQEPSG